MKWESPICLVIRYRNAHNQMIYDKTSWFNHRNEKGHPQTVVIVANGDIFLSVNECRKFSRPDIWVIAADGGLKNCLKTGIQPDILIGDMDSVSSDLLSQAKHGLKAIYTYPSRKDHTDLELAMAHAIDLGATELIILGALGGRWDMSLANITMLMSPVLNGKTVRIIDHNIEIRLLTDNTTLSLSGKPGDLLTLLPFGQPAEGITLNGLEYPLNDETLFPGATKGVSNVFKNQNVTISIQNGLLLCIHTQVDP